MIHISPVKNYSLHPKYGSSETLFKAIRMLKEKRKNICFDPPYFGIFWIIDKTNKKQYPLFTPENINFEYEIGRKINTCIKKENRFLVIPLLIKWVSNGKLEESGHQNLLIYDLEYKTLEHFDPLGSTFNAPNLTNFLKKLSKYFDRNALFLPLDFICPEFGLQYAENIGEFENIMEKGGFCLGWSVFYLDMMLKYPDEDPKDLQNAIINKFKDEGIDMRVFIKNYISHIANQYPIPQEVIDKFLEPLKKIS